MELIISFTFSCILKKEIFKSSYIQVESYKKEEMLFNEKKTSKYK